ncbi:sensor histidine kinase [Curtobacterium sp. VKM Ac-1395]|uniref:sensor histidine kinase n=1 Tax=Curtobacterium sp. VKM Ac-1395 TaxID=2783815 RepID=UPI00188B11DC|nr:HAMP domain-containing sensor histidine kinase [Curtobacterium sp. VKM Ac-1395]MBF4589230.1 HAMP domain-containing histidine kinase [Curtobacterium sp. VKM Ac-1395]
MTRTWSIRARTALVFALASMALAVAVVVFTNLMSQAALGSAGTVATLRDPTAAAQERGAELAFVRVVAVQQWQWAAVGVAGAGVVAGGIGWLLSRRMLRPIDRITDTATRISAANLHERIALDGPDDELRRLSRTVDDLLDRLETAFESQRRFVAQASHELRTPLTVQRAAIQIGLADGVDAEELATVRAGLLEQNRRTEHLVESLLVLAEADRGLAGDLAPVDLGSLAADVVAGVAGPADEAGVTVTLRSHTEPPGGAGPLVGEPTLVRQLLVNLVGNAVEYNVPGGFVHVTTTQAGIAVENSGPLVPGDVAPLLVEPFRRCADAVPGRRHSGLGLSIVASVAQAHGWHLRVEARQGGGLRVRVGVSSM